MKKLPLLFTLALVALALGQALVIPKEDARRLNVLFFGAPTGNGPGHDPVTRYRAIKKHLGADGIDFTYAENPAVVFNPEVLEQYDAVLMYGNWEQNGTMPPKQEEALISYVENGGAFLPIHCASACYGQSQKFVELVGAKFRSHRDAVFSPKNVNRTHPITKDLEPVNAWDETYVHSDHNDDRVILQKRDDEPWTWVREVGQGRVFYTASGHDHRVWDTPEFHELIKRAVYWSVGSDRYRLLKGFAIPTLEQEEVSLPGYRERKEITMAQKPLSPVESMKLAQVPVGFELSLFASEPDIVNPIYVNWDHRGRAFVIETIDYPNNLQRGNLGHDRITICEDTNNDGRADKFTRFAEKLSIPTSLVFANGGVICTNGSELLFLKDTNGDDKADVREVLIDGFNMGDTHAGPSNLKWGPDGWIYATIGYSGFNGKVGDENHRFAQGLFRFLPDGSQMEWLQPTTNNTWGLGFTAEFDILGSTANGNPSFYMTFPRKTYDSVSLDQGRTPRADDNPLLNPSSADIRQVDQFDRYTAAAGHAIYTANRFPSSYHNQVAFICGPTAKLVGHFDLERQGAGWKATQSPNNTYNSADAWSAPVCAEVGPDGALWICDWYNIIIQHNPTPSRNSAGINAQTGKGNAYETPHRDKEHGRIYRLYPTGSKDDANPGLDPSRPASLLKGLQHPNLFWRLTAQRLLEEQGDVTLAKELISLAKTNAEAGSHALYALDSLGQLTPSLLTDFLTQGQPAARRAAIALANPDQLKRAFLSDGTIKAEGRELADILVGLSLAGSDPAIGEALHNLAANQPGVIFEDSTLRDAWNIAARRHATTVLAAAGDRTTEEKSEPENLLPNGDFEEADNGQPSNWNDLRVYAGAGADQITVSTSPDGRSGNCLKITAKDYSDCGVAISVPVKRGVRYRLSGWLKTENLETRNNAPGALINLHGGQRTRSLKGTNEWTQVSVEFEAGSDRDALIHCLLSGYGVGRGTVYFDDLSLIALGNSNSLAGALESLQTFADQGDKPSVPTQRKFEPDSEIHERGLAVYSLTCVACHGVDGKGVPHSFPPLDGSSWATGDPERVAKIVLHGLMGPLERNGDQFNSAMPPLGSTLDDQQIADVMTYVRQTWSNDASPVSADFVKKVRQDTSKQQMMYQVKELEN
ncbi:PVC-type heme-binding CxxCH protein [Roseibacillus persicicus]|uniref:Cytochrome c domain-containing protein n=1 Tax=Roseibacillus persicicus TaxID=454148 RepID=A0A918TYM1_9BACT|nr:PVC-type heme-binding CxxCH protein [Roseibacillus persicicus]GHC66780.1 hypothetical protein GCM10007100_38320 [Roseibacillus persicicus]